MDRYNRPHFPPDLDAEAFAAFAACVESRGAATAEHLRKWWREVDPK